MNLRHTPVEAQFQVPMTRCVAASAQMVPSKFLPTYATIQICCMPQKIDMLLCHSYKLILIEGYVSSPPYVKLCSKYILFHVTFSISIKNLIPKLRMFHSRYCIARSGQKFRLKSVGIGSGECANQQTTRHTEIVFEHKPNAK